MWEPINATFRVASLYDCDDLSKYCGKVNRFDPVWRQTVSGCKILQVLRDMYKFNVTYIYEDSGMNSSAIGEIGRIAYFNNKSIDIYLRPMNFGVEHLKHFCPVHAAYNWRFGFILRLQDDILYRMFYSKPFSRPVWNCLYFIAFVVSALFYVLKRWEYKVIGGWECSYAYEILMVIGAYCQHIPPIDATLPSRRIAYFIFFLFTYIVYTFYTSNLLSHLVNDRNQEITLRDLASTSMERVIVNYMTLTVSENVPTNNQNYSRIVERLRQLRSVSIAEGIEGVKAGKMALLSDYTSLFPFIKRSFSSPEICELTSVDLFTNIKKYFFTAKEFPYREQFKIGALRAKETGIFRRLKKSEWEVPSCGAPHLVQTQFLQISTPVLVLFGTYMLSVVILVIERVYYQRTRVWPYVN
ncbi:ionotropic receptor 75a-like [Anticarsia gemmatalis]|uniref:ionotropic receptor 75a-like n=1 Tax=Anticarsia gemmatalis TaxID=129554 RepID=UPI003F75A99D